jgi:hypothetical protein
VVSSSRIDISWTDNSDDEAGFTIEGCTGAGCGAFVPLTTLGAGVMAHSFTSLSAGTTYRYRVRATGGFGSPPSNIAEGTTLSLSPSAPSGVAAAASGDNKITVTWQDNSTDETGFLIQRCSGLGCNIFSALGSVGPNVVSYQDLSAAIGVVYGYRVAAVNLGGTSSYSAPVEAVIQVPPPLAPSNLTATASTTAASVTLAWTDNSVSETQFQIESCQGAGCVNFTSLVLLGANVVAFEHTGLTPGTTYRYRVAASNGGGASGFSGIAEVATLPRLTVVVTPAFLAVTTGAPANYAVVVSSGGAPVEGATVNVTGFTAGPVPAPSTTNASGVASLVLQPLVLGGNVLQFVATKPGYLTSQVVTAVLTVIAGGP